MRKRLAIVVALIVIGGGFLWWWASRPTQKIRVLASEPVQRKTVRKVLEETGIIKSQVGAIVKIGARATGTIERMLVKVGERVAKDQLVAQIDDRELRSQASEAEAKLNSARAELERVEQVYPLLIAEAGHQLALAQAKSRYQKDNHRRMKRLAEGGVISQDQLDNVRQQADVETSQAETNQAVLERRRSEYKEERNKARLAVESAQAGLEAIEVRISYTRIYSPITGVVSQVTAQEGETIVAGLQVANLITVLDATRLEMWIYVDETDVGQVAMGQRVEFTVDAYANRHFDGAIDTVYPEPEIRDNIVYYLALVRLGPEQAELLRPEMTTQVQIIVTEKPDVPAIPNTALKWVNGRQLVFVQEPSGGIREAVVKLGLAGLTHSEVLEGLKENDLVATQLDLTSGLAKGKDK
jgi:HlyD family secretion protein